MDPTDCATCHQQGVEGFELRFHSLFHDGRGLSFPCDAAGHVDMDSMTERARSKYLSARALIGREFSWPVVVRVHQ